MAACRASGHHSVHRPDAGSVVMSQYGYAKRKYNVRTTSLGAGAIAIAVIGAAMAFFDGDPATNVDIDATMAAISAGLGLIFARDANITSEEAGEK